MKRASRAIKIMAAIAGGFLLCGAAALFMAGALFESSGVDRGSLVYRLGAPGHLRSVEILDECEKPKYRWKGRDGESHPYSSVTYGSLKSAAELFRSYQSTFDKQSCEMKDGIQSSGNKKHLMLVCAQQDFVSIDIFIADAGTCKEVTLDFLEND
ncbi:hypothetical protein [Acidovorax sp. NCPPB 3576]|uniref:hypothetical protein n=1 Tax=Acidovorax sp. NCPPB 3576 TaxID=2940488 RepID=UPI002349F978|nr:hypothetical protein [Acidovorax sp. NCPPB 3576]WCM88732.1 hypothetical protein M5C98_01310 [Acidovorax sp. NCPPB 3576]